MNPQRYVVALMSRRLFLAGSAASAFLASLGRLDAQATPPAGIAVPGIGSRILFLNGTDWSLEAAPPDQTSAQTISPMSASHGAAIAARVPGNVQSDLEQAHLLQPLWFGLGDARLASVAQQDWWYRKEFDLPELLTKERLRLVFDGVDFACEVWLNGELLGTHAGQFRRFAFDIAGKLNPGHKNQLAVKIKRMPEELSHCLSVSDGAMSGAETPNDFIACYVHTRQVLQDLKSVSNLSYDWGFNIYTQGIWRDVWLQSSGSSSIEWVQIETTLSDNYRKAKVTCRLEIDSQAALRARALFRLRGNGADLQVAVMSSLQKGRNVVEGAISLLAPALWWPNGQGEQPLYELQVQLEEAGTQKELDSQTLRFGVREVQWQTTEGAPPDFINPYGLVVNGRLIRMMGSDVVPPDLLFGRIGDRASRLVELAHAARMNTLRIWGGGVTMPPQFYDLADELGIMLSHEFPLANSLPETGPVFLANLRDTTTSILKQLRNHPSIIEWVGGNEMPWQQGMDHPALHVLEKVCGESDTRIFRATDPMQGSLHGPWEYHPRSHYQHYNGILETLSTPHPDLGVNTLNAMRYGEFGTQSPANLEVLQRDLPLASQWPFDDPSDPVMIRKNILQSAFSPIDWLMKPVIEGLFGPLDTLASLVEAGQFTGAEGLRYIYDELRRKGKRIGGLTSWDFNEPWTNGAGSYLVDYDGRTLMKYDFVRQALAPVSLTLRYNSILYDPFAGVHAGLWLTSDAPKAVSDLTWEWLARDRRGTSITHGRGIAASILPTQVLALAQVEVKPLLATALGPILVELRLKDARGTILEERVYIFGADNSFVWPLDGLLRNTGLDQDDDALLALQPRKVRVLWIEDSSDGQYENLAWYLRRFGIESTHVAATAASFRKVAPNAAELAKHYDAVWLGTGDYKKADRLAERLGADNLGILAEAVSAGLGLGLGGGWGGYADAGFEGSPLAGTLPVTFVGIGNAQRRGRTVAKVSNPGHPIAAGRLGGSLPHISGYNLVRAKAGSDIVFETSGGDSLLIADTQGKGRVLAYASGITGDVGWVDSPETRNYDGEQINWGWSFVAWSGWPFMMARMLCWLARWPDKEVSAIDWPDEKNRLVKPVRRTTLEATLGAPTMKGNEEVFAMELKNTGKMTALFCEPHPLLDYRTDITMLNNHACVPPGEARVITLQAGRNAGLTMSQIGWRISCWNAADVLIEPDEQVLLSLGRRDAMCREYRQPTVASGVEPEVLRLTGNRPDCSVLPWLLSGGDTSISVEFVFEVSRAQAARASRLRIHTADQDDRVGAAIEVRANGRKLEQRVGPGLGVQKSDPGHLAFPATAQFDFPVGTLRSGTNVVTVRVSDEGWFSWDSLDWVVSGV